MTEDFETLRHRVFTEALIEILEQNTLIISMLKGEKLNPKLKQEPLNTVPDTGTARIIQFPEQLSFELES